MKNSFILLFVCLLFSCERPSQVSITKVEGSPAFENAKLSLKDSLYQQGSDHLFSFHVEDYTLGEQTPKEFDYTLANSGQGQHIHLIINNGPYFAKYSQEFGQELEKGNNVILAFLSRSYHESVKNPNAYVLTQIGDGEEIDLTQELLFYSRPKGTYKGKDTEKVLLDFYLINTTISPDGNKVKATIQDTEFIIDQWEPYYIEGLPKGEISIKLELIDSDGELIDSPFNPSVRTVTLE
ncbi:MAG: hypothetical protein OXE77_01530 [Flavobacteriaceae bacterium]|nr:hypothetical protein [Flavobacteriaceae bacterium]MCY4267257.1 hypothetical protein [Flavobacteriaceae bacterium]MCY4298031.1 hypothetical protein [Flavobacteriaceae bacterium]